MENRARQKAKESERRVLKSAHGCCKGSMTKMKRGQTENPDSARREGVVKGNWQRRILEPDREEMEAMEVSKGRREGSGTTGGHVLWTRS